MKRLVLIFVFVVSGFCNGLLSINENTTLAEVQEQIKAGADVNAENEYGSTPIMIAALYNQNLKIIAALINAGADVNAKNKYESTALMFAAKWNPNMEIITALVKAGADTKARNKAGKTVLDYVRENESDVLANYIFLLEELDQNVGKKAQITEQNIDKKTLKKEQNKNNNVTKTKQANPLDIIRGTEFLSTLPPACGRSAMSVLEDGTVELDVFCSGGGKFRKNKIYIKDGVVTELQ